MIRALKSTVKSLVPRRFLPLANTAYQRLRAYSMRGGRFTCPCCGWSVRAFVKGRANSERYCPNCRSMTRIRWLWLELQAKQRLAKPLTLLHFAPEKTLVKRFKGMSHIRHITTDLFVGGVKTQMDITRLGFAENAFGGILCSHVLEHIPDDRGAMRELFRVLKPDGWAYIAVPLYMDRVTYEDPTITSPEDRLREFGQDDHVRIYGGDFVDRLQDAGFHVAIQYARELGADVVEKYGLKADEIMFLCTKS